MLFQYKIWLKMSSLLLCSLFFYEATPPHISESHVVKSHFVEKITKLFPLHVTSYDVPFRKSSFRISPQTSTTHLGAEFLDSQVWLLLIYWCLLFVAYCSLFSGQSNCTHLFINKSEVRILWIENNEPF